MTAEKTTREYSPAEKAMLRDIQQAARAGQIEQAARSARQAMAGGLYHPFLQGVIAMQLEMSGELEAAERVLAEALDRHPDDIGCLQARGLCLLRLEQPEAALPLFERVTALKPDLAPAFVGLGQALEGAGSLALAEAKYRRALELDAANIMAAAGLASVLSRRGDHEEARGLAQRVLAAEPDYPPAAMVVAEADLATRPAEAEARMRALAADPRVTPVEKSLALSVRGDALDRMDRAEEAFSAYAESNRLRHEFYADRFGGPEGTLAYARSLRQWFRDHPARDLLTVIPPEVADSPALGHAFLIGFPRSGTTLLEQVLASHPRVVALEERETLQDSVQAFMKSPAQLARLGLASDEELEPFRRRYWQRVAEANVMVNDKLFVDKHPLNGLKLPLVGRLFPQARILLAIRDPRDVVLSCFRRRFRISAPYYEMLTLQTAAELYDCVMELTHDLIAQMHLSVHVVRLERLIARFEDEVGAVCTFLDLGWHERMRDFAAGARGRGVATASGAQLARGLNAGGVGEWRRYRAQLQPVLPTLSRWAARFGYDPE